MAKGFTLGKNERLKSRKLIEQLFSEGKQFSSPPFKVLFLIEKTGIEVPGKFPLRFGVTVSRKKFRRAVDRNRVKRLTRECYRLQKKELEESAREKKILLSVFLVYTAGEIAEFDQVSEKLGVILKKLVKVVNENSAPNT